MTTTNHTENQSFFDSD